jgi:Zn-dependent M28 family amino/carboxypeptidase
VHACTALANVTMDHTLLCVLFDGEEEGALGSQAFLDDVLASKEWTLDAYLGFDMVGLNWPGKDPGADGRWRLYGWVGPEHADALHPFVNDTFTHVLGYPPEGAHVFPYNDRNSDEAVFAAAGIPTVRLAGGRTAGSYPQYHLPGDTTDFVEEFAGGHDRWVAGFGAIVRTATTLTLLLDRVGLDEMQRA